MNAKRTSLHFSGISAICFGGLLIVTIIVLLVGMQLHLVLVGTTTPDSVLALYQNGAYAIAALLRLIALLFLVPAISGFYAHLKQYAHTTLRIGLIFGIIAFFAYTLANFLQIGLIQKTAFLDETVSFTMKNDVFLIHQIIQFILNPNFVPLFLFLYLWGVAFKRVEDKWIAIVGMLFLITSALVIFEILFTYLEFEIVASVGLILKDLVFAAAWIIAGATIFKQANELN